MESPDGIYHGISIATVDETLWQMSDMLARAQLARQNSRNTPLRWQQQSRIHKSTSTGNSPQTLSRRRNAAYQQKLTYHAEANPVPSRSSFISSQHVHPRQSRPVTWHTSSHSISNTYLPAPCNNESVRKQDISAVNADNRPSAVCYHCTAYEHETPALP